MDELLRTEELEASRFTYNGSSVVDYVLAEEGIRERIVSFEVGDLQIHSDHCPLLLKLDTGISYNNRCEETRISSEVLLEEKLSRKEAECQINKEIGEAFWAGSWLKEHEEEFERRLSEAGWQDRMVKLCDDLDLVPLEDGAERLVRALTEVARDSGVLCMKKKGATQIRKMSTASFPSLRVLSRKDAKQFWKVLEMGKKQKKAQRSDRISQGNWVGHFTGIHQETGTTFGPPNFPVNTVTQLDTEISTEEVHLAIDRMKDGKIKASGADGLCAELFKNLDEVMLYTLTKLFNKVFQLGHFPASWA